MSAKEAAAKMAGLDPAVLASMRNMLQDQVIAEIKANDRISRAQFSDQHGKLGECSKDYRLADFEIWDRLDKMSKGTWTDWEQKKLELLQLGNLTLDESSQLTDEEQTMLDELYETCKSHEAELQELLTECEHVCREQKDVWSKFCGDNAPVANDVECTPYNGEAYREFLVRMETSMEGLQAALDSRPSCDPENGIVCGTFCGEFMMPPDAMPCCLNRSSAEKNQCKKNVNHRSHSDDYNSCYDTAKKEWAAIEFGHRAEAKARKAQMRGVLRMLCLINTFISGGSDHAAALKVCIDKDFSTDDDVISLDLPTYDIPVKLGSFNCSWWELPGTKEYDDVKYARLKDYKGLYPCPPMDCHEACATTAAHEDAGVEGNRLRTLSESVKEVHER
jgi:hypothetical protein